MMKMDRSKALILLSVVAFAAMLGGWYVTAYASGNSTTLQESGIGMAQELCGPGFKGSWMPGGGRRNGFVEVSAEYNQTVITIMESDQDVQNLLTNGYSISDVRPIIKSVVQADGTVVTKATSANVILTKDTTNTASVLVDVTAGKVTQIVIVTRTVIDKS
jgi:DNA-binding transcriptional regulator of glucitol operon